MGTLAILVDAGYLFAACAELLTGRRYEKRQNMLLDDDELIPLLHQIARQCEPAHELLRAYWYDAAPTGDRLSDQQRRIGLRPNMKLRLGLLNADNQQKGVDTLIVLDIVKLCLSKSVTSLILVTGDDDIRPAVEFAQEQGVRVHLIGIPIRNGRNQSERLQRECDSVTELSLAQVLQFFALLGDDGGIRQTDVNGSAPSSNGTVIRPFGIGEDDQPVELPDGWELADAVGHALELATADDLIGIVRNSSETFIDIPPDIYRRLLGRYGANLARSIDEDEKRAMRLYFLEDVKRRLPPDRGIIAEPASRRAPH